MKEVVDIFKMGESPEYITGQFNEIHPNKNVLFVNPQLNGRHFHKYILPYIIMFENNLWGTALTNFEPYKPNREYESKSVSLNSQQLLWADYIVFPFVTQELKSIYERIRSINPEIKIVFNVDFNYYALSKKHPLYDQFSEEGIKEHIEDNIFYSDLTFVTNPKLMDVLDEKFKTELSDTRYKDKLSKVQIGTVPILTDKEIVMENIEIKVPQLPIEELRPLRIGIVATNYTWEDLESYKPLFKEVKDKFKDQVKFIVMGFNGVDHQTQKNCFDEAFEFVEIPPCSIIHYYKQLRNLHLNLLFIPLRMNEFNTTSENYTKYIEAGLFNIPVMVYNIFPYSEIIKTGSNGILLYKKADFIERIEFFMNNRQELERIGNEANQFVLTNFTYNQESAMILDDMYTVIDDENE